MNTMVGGVPPKDVTNAFLGGQNDAEREALLGSIARTSSSSSSSDDNNNNNESSRGGGGGLRKTTTTFAMVAAAVGALAFASIGAAVVVGGGNGHHNIKARLGGGRAAAAVPTPNTFGVGEGTAALGNNNAQKKSARYAKVGLLGAMDIHAWPEPVEEEQHAPLEEHPDEEEEIQAAEEQAVEPQKPKEPIIAQAQPAVQPAVQEQAAAPNVLETANPQWVNQEAYAVQQQVAASGQVDSTPQPGVEQAAVAIDPQTGQPFATPADGGVSEDAQRTNVDLSEPPASWPVDMESGVQCNPIIGCIAGVPYPGIGCCETATLTPADVAPTQTQNQVPVNPYQYPIAGAVTTQPAAALPYGQQQQIQQQQTQNPYQQQLQAAPATGGVVQPAEQTSPVGENGLPECNVAEECIPGVPIPGIGCCNEAEKALIIADAQSRQKIDPVTGVPCNTDSNCVAGVPIPGIGCCESAESTVGLEEQQTQFYQQQQQIPGQYVGTASANPGASAVITAENAQPQMLNQIDPVTGQACNPNPGCVAGVPIPGIGCCTGTASRMIPGAPLVDAATGLPLVDQNPVDPATGKPLFAKACDATPTCVAGVPTPGVDSCCKQGECDSSPTCTAGSLEPGVNNCCHVCDPNPECQVGSEFPGIDTCCKPPPPPDYDGTPGNCDANPSCKPGVPDIGKNTCCPDNAACDTNPECIPGGTTPGVDTCCAETSLVKQKAQELGAGEVETKKQNPWKGCNPDPKCLPGVDIPGVDNCCKNCEPGVPTPGVDDCGVAKKRMWARSMRKNGMKNDQINEVIQKESKHTEQTAEEKEQNRQQMMLELKNRIKEEMARKESLLKAKKAQARASARASRGSSSA